MTVATLVSIAEVVRGVSFDKNDVSDRARGDYLPILRAGNIESELQLANDLVWVPASKVSTDQILQPGDIPICMSSGSPAVVGKTAIVRGPWHGSVGAFCAIVRPNSSLVVPEFLAFFLRSPAFRAWTKQSSGSSIKNIRKSELEGFPIELSPLVDQRRIVDLLSRADGIVRLRREAQKKAAELIPAIFLDMFGDPATNPKGWPVVPLGEALRAVDYGSSTKASDDGSGVPLIRMGNVGYDGSLDLSKLKYVQLEDAEVEKYRLLPGDILFNRTNSKDLVGKTGLWDDGLNAVVASYFIRLRVKQDLLMPVYLWAFMNTRHMKRVLFETARGAIGQANINSKELRAFRIGLPPLPLQEAFKRYVDFAESIIAQQDSALNKASATFEALLARSFTTEALA